ncbi:hypothetical protein Poli38472_008507 [Pythium oligandrum]|uniref:Uncharacterized protein n=1 Tax=Pythium oligandrum TaxID=41045 RepID=A0A8K1FCI2_PYTOL|nr:hypothetical protein Poli38472_008507 [Pythium oligandrum]|eukprot:TMW55859.1 hypothetical protein Poli38472_008507 [Pythium oligandrum]
MRRLNGLISPTYTYYYWGASSMWRQAYETAANGGEASDQSGKSPVERFLDVVLHETKDAVAQEDARKTVWRELAQELLVPMNELQGVVFNKSPPDTRVRVLQLQVVCRLLFHSTALTKPKTKKKKSKAKTKKAAAKDPLSELRALLDRLALLLDAANPVSIGEGDEEHSPFHHFLIEVLEWRLGKVMPDVFRLLREEYELTEETEPTPAMLALQTAFAPKIALETKPETPDSSASILSALKDERPSKKRSLGEANQGFNQVLLPGQLQRSQSLVSRRQLFPGQNSKLARPSSASSLTGRSHSDPKRTELTRSASVSSTSSKTSLTSLAAATKKAKVSRTPSTGSGSVPLLLRNVDQKLMPRRTMTQLFSTAAPGAPAPSTRIPPKSTVQRSSASMTKGNVVMRTPDRPQRVSRQQQKRILIEASPPLRNPFAGRTRRPGPNLPQ